MRRNSYYWLFPLYLFMLVFILYMNGVFTGEIDSVSNFILNMVFFPSDRYSDVDLFRTVPQSQSGIRSTDSCGGEHEYEAPDHRRKPLEAV